MASLMQSASQPSTAPLPPDLEPDEEWKQTLKVNIEAGLRSMVDEAKQKLHDELAKGIISPDERERLTTDHLAALKNIRQLAEEQFRIALERERQERRWASGEQLDREWSESMMKEQQAILDRIERERKSQAPAPPSAGSSSQPDPQPHPQPPPPPQPQPPPARQPDVVPETFVSASSSTPVRRVERERVARTPNHAIDSERDTGPYFSRPTNHERDDFPVSPDEIPVTRPAGKVRAGSITSSMGSYKPPSILETDRSFLERSKPSPLYDDPEFMPRSARTPTDPPDSARRESIRRKPSMNARPIVQEFWKPSITPEEDAQMSRTFTLARRSSTASATSSFKAPSILSTTFTDPLDVASSNIDRERSSIHSADQEWSGMDRARERDREREREGRGYGHPDERPSHNGYRMAHLEERLGFTTAPLNPSSSTTHSRASDSSRVYPPPPSASRPIVNKRSFTLDDAFPPQSNPGSRNWNSRSPYEARWEGSSSRSPQTEDTSRSWQSSHLRGRFSSQDMRHHFLQEGNYHGARHVHTHPEDFEDGSDDGLDSRNWRTRDYNERRVQDLEDSLRKREEAASKREEELARKMEEIKREEEARKRKIEESRREEEAKRLEEEAKQREEDEIERKEAELREKEEEANRKERIAAKKAEEARRLEEEARRKTEEARRKEEEARRKEEEAKRKEEEVRRKEREARLKEEEAKRKEEEVRKMEAEAKRKEEEVRKMEAGVRKKEEEAKKKEREAQLKEEDAKRKEKEVKSRELEARRQVEEARRKEAEATRKEEEVSFREMEARRLEEEARRKEEDAKLIEEEARRREQEVRRKAEEARLKEEEMHQRADELHRREEDIQRREEDLIRREVEIRRREEDKQQEEFRKREEEIRRQRLDDRKKQEVWETWPQEAFRPSPSPQTPSSSGPWPIPNRGNERSAPPASPPADRTSTSASRSNSGWTSASARPSSTNTASSQPSSTPTPKPPPPSSPNPPLNEAEFHRRQAEQAQQREEQFRREQARFAMQDHERQAKTGKTMSKEDVAKLFESHRNQWDKIPTLGSLIWEDFPWPMFKRPKSPEELTSPAITAYMLSPVHLQDRGAKERIKDNIRRWHPDRFNSQLLPKVKESERDKVSEGAGLVARILNDLLRMNSQDIF